MLTVDTDIWAYYFAADLPEHERVVAPVEKALKSEQILINTVMIMELGHFLMKGLGPVTGREEMGLFLRFPLVVSDFGYREALDSMALLERYSHLGVGGRDATILAMMRRTGAKKIMTHDAALKKVDWVQAFDPIKASRTG